MADAPVTTDAAPAAAIAPTAKDVAPAGITSAVTSDSAPKVADAKPADATPVAPKTDAPKEPAKDGEPVNLGPKKDEKTAPAAPIKYEFKLPEGVKLDEKQLATFGELGNKLGLQPEAAQELFDYHYNALAAANKNGTVAAEKAYNDLIGEWKGGIAADPELSGSNEAPAKELLGKFLDEYGSPEARKALDLTGAGWNPAVIKMVLKAAKALSEGGPTSPGNPGGARKLKTPGNTLYPEQPN